MSIPFFKLTKIFFHTILREMNNEFMTIKRAAERKGVTRQTVCLWINRGLLPAFRADNDTPKSPWLIRATDIDAFVPPLEAIRAKRAARRVGVTG